MEIKSIYEFEKEYLRLKAKIRRNPSRKNIKKLENLLAQQKALIGGC